MVARRVLALVVAMVVVPLSTLAVVVWPYGPVVVIQERRYHRPWERSVLVEGWWRVRIVIVVIW